MLRTERQGDELFVYWNETLIYKRWLRHGYGKVFDKWGHPFTAKEIDNKRNKE